VLRAGDYFIIPFFVFRERHEGGFLPTGGKNQFSMDDNKKCFEVVSKPQIMFESSAGGGASHLISTMIFMVLSKHPAD
jgi:hypothetical protein